MRTPPILPTEKESATKLPYGDTLRAMLDDIASQEKKILAAEATIAM
jgi:hypothetical protein